MRREARKHGPEGRRAAAGRTTRKRRTRPTAEGRRAAGCSFSPDGRRRAAGGGRRALFFLEQRGLRGGVGQFKLQVVAARIVQVRQAAASFPGVRVAGAGGVAAAWMALRSALRRDGRRRRGWVGEGGGEEGNSRGQAGSRSPHLPLSTKAGSRCGGRVCRDRGCGRAADCGGPARRYMCDVGCEGGVCACVCARACARERSLIGMFRC